jgi:hypothetical protein
LPSRETLVKIIKKKILLVSTFAAVVIITDVVDVAVEVDVGFVIIVDSCIGFVAVYNNGI